MSSFLTENPALCRLWGVNAALGILTSRAYLERAQQDAQQHGGERGDGHRGALALIVALSRMPTQLMELVAQKASSHRHLTISDVSMLCKIRCLGPHHALPRRVVVDLRGASVRAGGYSVALVLSDTGCVTLRNGSIDLGGPRMSSSSAERARFASLVVKAADGTVLENLKLRDGPGHGILVDGAKAELRNVSVEYLNASGHGHPPPMPTYGLLCINGAEVTLKSCTFACCGAGIGAAGSKIVARSVQIHQNAQWGVNATHGGSLELTRASISGSAIGVACEGSESRLAITGGRIAGCHKYGVAVRGQAHAQIAGLHVARCGVVGIVAAEAGTFLECRGVKVSRCVGDGVQVTHGAAARMMAGDVGSGRVKATVSREHSGRGYLATGLGSSLECYNCVAHSCGTRGVLVASGARCSFLGGSIRNCGRNSCMVHGDRSSCRLWGPRISGNGAEFGDTPATSTQHATLVRTAPPGVPLDAVLDPEALFDAVQALAEEAAAAGGPREGLHPEVEGGTLAADAAGQAVAGALTMTTEAAGAFAAFDDAVVGAGDGEDAARQRWRSRVELARVAIYAGMLLMALLATAMSGRIVLETMAREAILEQQGWRGGEGAGRQDFDDERFREPRAEL